MSAQNSKQLLLVYFITLTLASKGETPDFHFENFTTENGLSNNEVSCFYQDKNGFLWIGTKFGLNKFDGNQFQSFYHNPNDSNSLSGNQIVDLLQDENGVFWVATKDGGLTRYDPLAQHGKQFDQFINSPENPLSFPTNRLNCVFNYSSKYIMAGAEGFPIVLIDKKSLKVVRWTAVMDTSDLFSLFNADIKQQLLWSPWVHKIKRQNDTLFISFLSATIVYRIVKNRLYNPKYNPSIEADPSGILTIPDFCIDGKKIWCTSWKQGLFLQQDSFFNDHWTISTKKFGDFNDVAKAVSNYNQQYLLVASASTGLYLIDKNNGKKISFRNRKSEPYSLASNQTTSLFKDRDGNWWIGTLEGFSRFDSKQWQIKITPILSDAFPDFTSFSIFEDDENILRICTSDGIYKKASGEKSFHLVPFEFRNKLLSTTLIHEYAPGEFILGTELSFFKYYPRSETIEPVPEDKQFNFHTGLYDFGTFQIRSMVSDTLHQHPVLMYAPLGWGLGLYDLVTKERFDFIVNHSIKNSIGNNLSRKIIKDKMGVIWVATSGGLFKWRGQSELINDFDSYFHIPNDSSSISSNDISDIFADANNHLWITTIGGALNEFDGNRFTCYRADLPQSNLMYGIYADRSNRFWIPSAAGFEVFDRAEKRFFHVRVFNSTIMLRPPAQIMLDKNGTMMYAAKNFLVSFQPDSLRFDKTFPKIYLTDFKVMDQSIFQTSVYSNLRLPYNKNFITIDFSSLQLSHSSQVKYQYQLAGLNDEWFFEDADGKANFMSLPPANYTFKVKAANAEGKWSDALNLVSFTILKPYWQEWWFYMLVLAVIIFITWYIISLRFRQILRLQTVRNRIANDLHDDVGSALSTISLYTEVAQLKSSDEIGLKQILTKISATSQEMQENMNFIVWSIQPRNDRFDHMVLRMKQYAIEVLQTKNVQVQFEYDEKVQAIKFFAEQRKEIFLIFKETVNNISKYANCRSVSICLERNGNQFRMTISDDGSGFIYKDKYAGNGLHSMNERARTLNGIINIRSTPGKGTVVELQLVV
ncbi:MAG: hypothetical protein H0W62_01160 [Chitinophagales bacterium]|nr:hypothetical protein [Chitinophagales bacterium]